jgi:aminoglycoside 6'-N-acetyltransferase I
VAGGSGRHGLEIRAATAADAPFLCELLAAAGRPVEPRILADRLALIRRDDGVCLIASAWGPPSGVMTLHWIQPIDAARQAAASLFLVAPDARRRGIGRLLLKAGSQAARSAGCDELRLLAPPDAAELLAFCQETGFEADGQAWSRPLRRRR